MIASMAASLILAGCGGGSMAKTPVTQANLPTAGAPAGTAPNSNPAGASPVSSSPSHPGNATVINLIQGKGGWESCSATFANGAVCAAGRGKADAWMAQNQKSPSMSGSAAEFHIGGATPYSNNLWWNQLGGNNGPSHFLYDFWVYTKDPEAPEAIEFDVNQSFGGTRWVFGTECNFKGTGKWDVWDGGAFRWRPSQVSCPTLQANTWTHFTWEFERVGHQVHYVSLTINGSKHPVDMYLPAEEHNGAYEINVAVQLDGNFRQQPYEIYVDNLNLIYW